jgi:hypothetical protein
MLEYIFFNKKTCQLFAKSATSSDITPIINCAESSFTVRLPEDLEEDLLQKLEDYYDELMEMDRTLTEQEGSAQDIHAAGINIQLKDGRYVYATVPPELLNRVMQCISTDELNTLVCAITEAVEDPDESSLCQR